MWETEREREKKREVERAVRDDEDDLGMRDICDVWERMICFDFVWKFLFDVMVNVHWRGRLEDRVVLLNSYYFKVRKSLQQ